jgi:hypothetical protein
MQISAWDLLRQRLRRTVTVSEFRKLGDSGHSATFGFDVIMLDWSVKWTYRPVCVLTGSEYPAGTFRYSDYCGDPTVLQPEIISFYNNLRSAWLCSCTVCRVPYLPSPSFVSTLHHTRSVHRTDPVTSHTVTVTDEAGGAEITWTGTGGHAVLVVRSVTLEHFKKRHNQGLEGDI